MRLAALAICCFALGGCASGLTLVSSSINSMMGMESENLLFSGKFEELVARRRAPGSFAAPADRRTLQRVPLLSPGIRLGSLACLKFPYIYRSYAEALVETGRFDQAEKICDEGLSRVRAVAGQVGERIRSGTPSPGSTVSWSASRMRRLVPRRRRREVP